MTAENLNETAVTEAARLRSALERLRVERRLPKSHIDRALGREKGYYGQILAGRMSLTAERFFGILVALQVSPPEFFALLYPRKEPAADFERAHALVKGSAARYLAQTLQKKGVLDDTEAAELLRRLDDGR